MSFYVKVFIILTAFLPVAVSVKSIIDMLFSLIFASKFGLKCSQISLFGIMLINHDGKWNYSFDKFVPLCQHNVIVDLSKQIPEDAEKKDKQYSALRVAVLLLASVCILVLCRNSVAELRDFKDISAIDLFVSSFAIGMVYHSLASLIICIYTYNVVMKRLGGYVRILTDRLRRGETFKSLELKPVNQLPYKNPSNTEKMMYYNFYLAYLLSEGRVGDMQAPICEMTTLLSSRDYIMQETLNYYWLIFYYSRFEINPTLADLFLEKVRAVIFNDLDSNAKRVLAYYYYGIKQDVNRAKRYVDEGLASLDKFSVSGDERELERKLLLELNEHIAASQLCGVNQEK